MIGKLKKMFGVDVPDIPDVPAVPEKAEDFERIVERFVFNRFKEHFEDHMDREHPEVNRDAAWEKIEESIHGYVDDVLDDIDNSMDQFYYWIETDCDDFSVDPENYVIYKSGDVKSLPNPYPNGTAVEAVWAEDDEPWSVDADEDCLTCGTPIPNGKTCPECDKEDKEDKEKLVDWGEADKAW